MDEILLWQGEASVACDDVVNGPAGVGLFGASIAMTQFCNVEVSIFSLFLPTLPH